MATSPDYDEVRGDTRTRRAILSADLSDVTRVVLFLSNRSMAEAKRYPCTVVDAAGGVVEWQFDGTDATGTYGMEWETRRPGGPGGGDMVATFPSLATMTLVIRKDLGDDPLT